MTIAAPHPNMSVAEVIAALGPVAAVHEGGLRALIGRAGPSAALLGEPLPGATRAGRVGPIAVLPISGVISPRPSFLSEAFGWTDLETFRRDLEVALGAPEIAAILLDVNSPGGIVEGVNGAARAVFDAGKRKPIAAWVGGIAASAAYWLISGVRDIAVEATASVGSIGATITATLQVQPDFQGRQQFDISNTDATRKHPDPRTEEGAAELRRIADDLAAEMTATIRAHRPQLTDMRGGAIEIGKAAVAANLADRVVASIEIAAQALAPQRGLGAPRVARVQGRLSWQQPNERMTAMDYAALTAETLKQHRPDLVTALTDQAVSAARQAATQGSTAATAAARTEGHAAGLIDGAKAERERIAGIEASALPGHETLVAAAKADGKTTGAELAVKIIAAAKAAGQTTLAAMKTDAPKAVATDAPKDGPVPPTEQSALAQAQKLATAAQALIATAAKEGRTLSAADAVAQVQKAAA